MLTETVNTWRHARPKLRKECTAAGQLQDGHHDLRSLDSKQEDQSVEEGTEHLTIPDESQERGRICSNTWSITAYQPTIMRRMGREIESGAAAPYSFRDFYMVSSSVSHDYEEQRLGRSRSSIFGLQLRKHFRDTRNNVLTKYLTKTTLLTMQGVVCTLSLASPSQANGWRIPEGLAIAAP